MTDETIGECQGEHYCPNCGRYWECAPDCALGDIDAVCPGCEGEPLDPEWER